MRENSRTRYSFRVIAVGNIEAGGTGKTPVTAELARTALLKGHKVVILTRGYKGNAEKTGKILAPFETESASVIGDEPALLRELVPGAWIGIGAHRKKTLETLLARLESNSEKMPDLVLLDDGFQQFWIHTDARVVCFSGRNWGEDTYFRDGFESITNEDFVLLTKSKHFPAPIARHPRKIHLEWEIPSPLNLSQGYFLVHGVGRPDTVRKGFEMAGWRILAEKTFPDHAEYSRSEVEDLLHHAETNRLRVVTTGKDAVKWKALGLSSDRYEVIEPKIRVVNGLALWKSIESLL